MMQAHHMVLIIIREYFSSTPLNIMGTTARPNQIDEDNISSTVGNGNNGTRVPCRICWR